MTRRVEGPRLETGRVDTSGHEAQQAERLSQKALSRRRLNGVDKTAGHTRDASAASQSNRPEMADFQAPSNPFGRSVDDALVDFVMPRIPEPAILRRSVSILQHCVNELVPDLDGGDQLKSLAKTLIGDEIERHRELLSRLQGGTET